jgi:hypothetical protein
MARVVAGFVLTRRLRKGDRAPDRVAAWPAGGAMQACPLNRGVEEGGALTRSCSFNQPAPPTHGEFDRNAVAATGAIAQF